MVDCLGMDVMLGYSLFLYIFIRVWITPILVVVLNFSAAPLVGTPGSQKEGGSHLMLGSLYLFCFGYTMSCFVPTSNLDISIHILVYGSYFWISFELLVVF